MLKGYHNEEDHPVMAAIIKVRDEATAADVNDFSDDKLRSVRYEAADNMLIKIYKAVKVALLEMEKPKEETTDDASGAATA